MTQAQACASAEELIESPHLVALTPADERGSPVYTFPLFTPAYGEALAEELRHFEESCGDARGRLFVCGRCVENGTVGMRAERATTHGMTTLFPRPY